jgi:hypothetical protein
LLVAESRFRRLNAPELAKRVYLGIKYHDGIEVTKKEARRVSPVFTPLGDTSCTTASKRWRS